MRQTFNAVTFGKRLGAAMRKRDMTVRAAAEQIGLSPSSVNRIRHGGEPSVESYLRVLKWVEKQEARA